MEGLIEIKDIPRSDTGTLSFNDQLTPKAFAKYQVELDLWKNDLVSSEASPLGRSVLGADQQVTDNVLAVVLLQVDRI